MTTVHLPDDLAALAKEAAARENISLDQFIATAVAEKVAVLNADTYIQERAACGSREKFERVLSKVPDVTPDERDQ